LVIQVDNEVMWFVTSYSLYKVDKERKISEVYKRQEDDKVMRDVTTTNTNNNEVFILYYDKIRVINVTKRTSIKCLGKFSDATHIRRDLLNNYFIVSDYGDNQVVIIDDAGAVIKAIKLSSKPSGIEVDNKNNLLYVLLYDPGYIVCYKC